MMLWFICFCLAIIWWVFCILDDYKFWKKTKKYIEELESENDYLREKIDTIQDYLNSIYSNLWKN